MPYASPFPGAPLSTVEPARLASAAALGAALSAAGNVLVFFAAGAAGGVRIPDPESPGAFLDLPLALVLVASVVPAVPGAALHGALLRFGGPRAQSVFLGICVVFTLLSMGGPAGAPDPLSKGVLALMHVVSAVAIGGALLRRGSR